MDRTRVILGAVLVGSLIVVVAPAATSAWRRAQTMRDDAGKTVYCYSPTLVRPCTVGEWEDALRADVDGCEAGNARRCGILAWRYRNGNGFPQDEARATRLFAQACEAGDPYSCPEYIGLDARGPDAQE
jgi:TPR repeat protein